MVRPGWVLGTVLWIVAIAVGVWWLATGPLAMPLEMMRLQQTPPALALPSPVAGVSPRRMTDTWGAARSDGRRHEGIDIFAPRGTAVLSTTEGVATPGNNNLGGKVMWVLGPGGERHYYAHLDSWADLESGSWVHIGDTLGFVGNSGNAITTPPHLHYGIYGQNGARNPWLVLRPGGMKLDVGLVE